MKKYIIDENNLRRLVIKELKYDYLCENVSAEYRIGEDAVVNYQYVIDYALNSFPIYKEKTDD